MAKGKKTEKRKFYEIFEIGKGGKEKKVVAEGFEEEKGPGKNQAAEENRILRGIFITIGLIAAAVLIGYFALNSMNSFTYKGVDFKKVSFCDTKPCLIVYQTSLPVLVGGKKADYNFYLDRKSVV